MSRDSRLRLAFLGIHPERAARLVSSFGGAGRTMRAIEKGDVQVSDAVRARIADAAACRRRLVALGIEAVFREDDAYPEHLASLPGAPDLLFVRGTLPPTAGVAVVGTRRCTSYGRRIARALGAALGGAGWPVISGLARGIDGAAHLGAVEGGGCAVAVLGCGSDVMYPAEHRDLHDEVVATGGAVATEYPPGTPPEGWRFPLRNRVISGLAGVVVVVESAVTGGALVTASAALDQGRPVLAVPGDVTRASSEGCNLLIRDGAVPVLGADDLIEAVSLVLGPAPAAAVKPPRRDMGVEDVEAEVMESGRPASEVLREKVKREMAGPGSGPGAIGTQVSRPRSR